MDLAEVGVGWAGLLLLLQPIGNEWATWIEGALAVSVFAAPKCWTGA
jgi:hypothetical protein